MAIDAGVDQLLRYGGVQVTSVLPLVHGAMFTRGGDDLKHTAIFIGGSDVDIAERLMTACRNAFFGPIRVSLMLDANGCNTTASAAVVAAGRHVDLAGPKSVVFGGTVRLAAGSHSYWQPTVPTSLTSRSLERAELACREIAAKLVGAKVTPSRLGRPMRRRWPSRCRSRDCLRRRGGRTGFRIVNSRGRNLKVAIDLNAVPPAGIGGLAVTEKAHPLEVVSAMEPSASED